MTVVNLPPWKRGYRPTDDEWNAAFERASAADKVSKSGDAMNGTLAVTTTGLVPAHNVVQNGSGTASYATFNSWPHAGFGYNYKLIASDQVALASDSIAVGRGIVIGDTVDHVINGAGVNGSRVAHGAFMRQAGATANVNVTDFVGASWHFAQAVAPMVGSSAGTPLGNLFGMCPQVQLYTGATNYISIMGAEVDVEVDVGASVQYKYGACITTIGADAVHGSIQEAALHIGAVTSSGGWANGIKFSTFNAGGVPISITGSLLSTVPVAPMTTWTAAHGIDLRGITLTGFALAVGPDVNAPVLTISGAGNLNGQSALFTNLAVTAAASIGALTVIHDVVIEGNTSGANGSFVALSVSGSTTLGAVHASGLVSLDQGLNVNGYVTTGQGLSVGGLINLPPMITPPAPASGIDLYVDIADGKLKAKAPSGAVTVLASP